MTREDIFSRTIPEPNSGCWLWAGSVSEKGYGIMHHRKARGVYAHLRAHRVSYSVFFADISDGKMVCHRCDVRSCVNPDHLFLGTAAENTRDMQRKGRGMLPNQAVNGRCCNGHVITHQNTQISTRRGKPERRCLDCVREQKRRSARLLSASRELLQALKLLHARTAGIIEGRSNEDDALNARVAAAIAKAECDA